MPFFSKFNVLFWTTPFFGWKEMYGRIEVFIESKICHRANREPPIYTYIDWSLILLVFYRQNEPHGSCAVHRDVRRPTFRRGLVGRLPGREIVWVGPLVGCRRYAMWQTSWDWIQVLPECWHCQLCPARLQAVPEFQIWVSGNQHRQTLLWSRCEGLTHAPAKWWQGWLVPVSNLKCYDSQGIFV